MAAAAATTTRSYYYLHHNPRTHLPTSSSSSNLSLYPSLPISSLSVSAAKRRPPPASAAVAPLRPVARQHQQRGPAGPAKKRPPRRRAPEKGRGGGGGSGRVAELVRAPPAVEVAEAEEEEEEEMEEWMAERSRPPTPLPKPPAGFVLDAHGRVIAAASKRIVTIVDETDNTPLECVIRRVFQSSQGDECMLLCPVDTPVLILKSSNFDGWSAVPDDEIDSILPSAEYALAKIHMHLVASGFCYTARGGFCYSEEDILEFQTDTGEDIEGVPSEGIEITCFNLNGAHYMIYTPSDPVLFVAVKDKNGVLRIAEDELLDDPAVVGAVDEETEFNALVEEEAALLESLLGER